MVSVASDPPLHAVCILSHDMVSHGIVSHTNVPSTTVAVLMAPAGVIGWSAYNMHDIALNISARLIDFNMIYLFVFD